MNDLDKERLLKEAMIDFKKAEIKALTDQVINFIYVYQQLEKATKKGHCGRDFEVLLQLLHGNKKVDEIAQILGMERTNVVRSFRNLNKRFDIDLKKLGIKKKGNKYV